MARKARSVVDNLCSGERSSGTHTPSMRNKPSVLFLCDGSEGHALVAQSILSHKAKSYFSSFGAHTSKNGNPQAACKLLHHYNIACSDRDFQPVARYQQMHLDYLIALCPASVQSGHPLPRYEKFIPWDITQGGELVGSQHAIKYINDQINYFLSVYLYR